MSNTPKSIVSRQWRIIEFLIKQDHYVSAEDIKQYLDTQGISVELRTVQRDLNNLKQNFPLECRDDDKPYGWRWARLQNGKQHELTFVQALAFRLIETQLQEHLPNELFAQLEPLFIKARFILTNEYWTPKSQETLLNTLIGNLPRPVNDRTRSVVPQPMSIARLLGIKKAQTMPRSTIVAQLLHMMPDNPEHQSDDNTQIISQTHHCLKQFGFDELADAIIDQS
ncbi:hypothetical protein ACFBZI_10295 [Moraxella sp. ZJ142]|uniref:hypothetical protein n=1 Tax=Moraxella marmotae TaxID=3344520 RepID=UPI0035D4BE4C